MKLLLIAKANAYGNGLNTIKYLEDKVDYIGVAIADEGRRLRLLGITKPILILSYNKDDFEIARKYDLTVGLSDISQLDRGLKYHIAVDTGMNRFGIKSLKDMKSLIKISDKDCIKGMFSHIYDNSNVVLNAQKAKFDEFNELFKSWCPDGISHILSSGSYKTTQMHYDMVRIGLEAYKNCCAVISKVLLTKTIEKGESVGYNGEYVSDKKRKIALIEGGYADGIDRRNCGGNVIIQNRYCKIIGKISMDTFMADISGLNVSIGDNAVLCDSGDITISDIAGRCRVSDYEIMTNMQGRYKYVWLN